MRRNKLYLLGMAFFIVILIVNSYCSYRRQYIANELRNKGCLPTLTFCGAYCQVCGKTL